MSDRWPPDSVAPNLRVPLAVLACVLVTTAAGSAGGVAAPAVTDSGLSDTPATAATDVQNQSLPPGTNESGITNATVLLDAHDRALRNTTYTERLVTGERLQGQDPAAAGPTTDPVRVTVRNGSAGTNTTITARGSHSEYWTTDNTSAEYSANTQENVTSELYWYEEGNVSGFDAGPSAVADIQREVLSTYVRSAAYRYEGTVTRGNDTLHEFVATAGNSTNRTTEGLSTSVQRADATLLVSERGVVRELSAVVERDTQNGTVATRTNYSVTDVGETTTTEPAWLTEHLPRFDVQVTNDNRVVALEYTVGAGATNETLPPETGVFVYSERGSAATTLDATLARGDTLYLWTESRATTLQRSVNEPPTVTESFAPFEGTDASYLVSRFVLTSANRETTSSSTTIEVYVGNETARGNRSAPSRNATRSS